MAKFGANLLHYKTIWEIEARKELYELAKKTTQSIMEDDNDGFRDQCARTVNVFVDKLRDLSLWEGVAQWELEVIDLEFKRALVGLKDDFVQKALVLFNKAANWDPRFHETMKEEARKKLGTPLDWMFENFLYSWKLQMKKKNDEHGMQKMWKHFTSVLNSCLQSNSALDEGSAKDLFDKEWSVYESSFQDRVKKI